MKKKSLALIVVASLMIASIATALTLAYFTDTKTATNTFTVGNVVIELTEPNWAPGEDNTVKINPGVAVPKDPTVENTGANDAYVRTKVTISNASAFTPAELAALLGGVSTDWTLVPGAAVDANTITYVYTYNAILAPNATTPAVFTTVTLPGTFNNANVANLAGFNIKVVAEAIQADGFTDAAAAFAALDAQLLTP